MSSIVPMIKVNLALHSHASIHACMHSSVRTNEKQSSADEGYAGLLLLRLPITSSRFSDKLGYAIHTYYVVIVSIWTRMT